MNGRTRVAIALLLMGLGAGRATANPGLDPPATAPGIAHREPAARTPMMSVDEVRPGMTGYGLTVFSGMKPERFPVRVIGVMRKFRPLTDVVLITSDDPRLKYSGAVQGMSGSPIYIEGKLLGAFAYGFSFAKDMIAGVTPIEYMVREMRRPRRGPDATTGMARSEHGPATAEMRGRGDDAAHALLQGALADQSERPWWQRLLPRAEPPAPLRSDLVRASVPLAAAGFSGRALAVLESAFRPYGLVPMAGAGGGRPPHPTGPTDFRPGESIGVEMVRGDMSMVGTGTVTYVDGSSVAGFGHPMFGAGEIYLPVVTSYIHTFLNSVSQSFKLASPLREAASLVQDRDSCIVADTSQRTKMIPMRVTIRGAGHETRIFRAEIARYRYLMPMLANAVVSNAMTTGDSDVTHAVATIKSRVQVHGYPALELEDNVYAPDGLGGRALAGMSGLRALGEVMFNPFQTAAVDGIEVDMNIAFRPDFAEITGLRTNAGEVEPGARINLYVTLRPFDGPEYVETIPIEIPAALAGQTLKIEAAAGNLVRPDMAPAENLKELLDNLRKSFSSRTIVVTLHTPGEGATIQGKLLPDLPSSEIDTLRPSASTRRGDPYKRYARTLKTVPRILMGKQEIALVVRNEIGR